MISTLFDFNGIRNYSKSLLKGDLSAGLTVGIMLIPQGMAYSMLAGLPPIYGLYTSTLALVIYGLLGSSRQLSVGPSALIALLVATSVGTLAESGTSEYITLTIQLTLLVGLIQLLVGFLRLGFLVNFLSTPVIQGFITAAALFISLSQIKNILGISVPRGNFLETLITTVQSIGLTNVFSLTIGGIGIALLLLFKKFAKSIPSQLVVVLLGILAVYVFQFDEKGVAIVKDIPSGLPNLVFPSLDSAKITALLPAALAIVFVGYIQSIATAKAIQRIHKTYRIKPNRELFALGFGNMAGSLIQSFPAMGGFGRSAVNNSAGAKTGLASIISAAVVVLTLLFLTPYFYYLPIPILAAIIIVAVSSLIKPKELFQLWYSDRTDFFLMILTALSTLFIGIQEGIIIGIILSLAMIIYKVSYPHIAHLGKIKDNPYYRNILRFDDLEEDPKTLIVRIDAPIYFANATYIRDHLEHLMSLKPGLESVIVSGQPVSSIDSSGLQMIRDLVTDSKKDGIQYYFSGLIGPLRDILQSCDEFENLGKARFFMNIQDAVDAINNKDLPKEKPFVFQNNAKRLEI